MGPKLTESGQGEPADVEVAGGMRGRGVTKKKARTADACAAKRILDRTIFIPDEIFGRFLVQSHRHNHTTSDLVVSILERQVPDHRIARGTDPAADIG